MQSSLDLRPRKYETPLKLDNMNIFLNVLVTFVLILIVNLSKN